MTREGPLAIDAKRLERAVARASGIVDEVRRELRIDDPMERMTVEVYAPLTLWLADRWREAGRPLVVGVHGAQGSGKSTLAMMLKRLLPALEGTRTAAFSLDDIYLERDARARLGREVHPLLALRGVPGTHEVGLGLKTLDALAAADEGAKTPLPSFDKAVDDRLPEAAWPVWEGEADVILFEGWCVGVPAQDPSLLEAPVNALEAEDDDEGIWRGHVNARLEDEYAELWSRLDVLIMLAVPSMEQVVEWRKLQERKLREALSGAAEGARSRVMSDDEVSRFVMLFERLTRHALETLPSRADVTIHLGADHQPLSVEA